MILNNSRADQFRACQRKTYYWNELKLRAHREAEALLVGGAFHKGLEVINRYAAKQDALPTDEVLEHAVHQAEAEFKKRIDWSTLLKEELPFYEEQLKLAKMSVSVYGKHYVGEKYQILKPEVPFTIPLEGTEHHCWYFHRLLHPEDKGHKDIDASGFGPLDNEIVQLCDDERCWQPHYVAGTSDGVIVWNRVVWLLEHKTTAYDLHAANNQSKNYVKGWQLNTQATHYIYGVWKATGVRPHGVLLNAVIKPRKNAATPRFSFYREGFLRTEEDLERYEREIAILATDYEHRMRTGTHIMNPSSCFDYNRVCYFHNTCVKHKVDPGEFVQRDRDYVEDAYYKILGLEVPEHASKV